MLRIAVQSKGRLYEDTMNLLKEADIKVSESKRTLLVQSTNFPLEVLFLRDDDRRSSARSRRLLLPTTCACSSTISRACSVPSRRLSAMPISFVRWASPSADCRWLFPKPLTIQAFLGSTERRLPPLTQAFFADS